MSELKIFFQYFKKHKYKKIQYFFQILFCIISIVIFIGMFLNINNKFQEIKSITSVSNIKGGLVDNIYTDKKISFEEHNKILESFVDEMKNNNNIFDLYQFTFQTGEHEPTQVYIDNNLNKNIGFPVSQGRTFNDEDFKINYANEPVIPILISKRLENIHPLNSEFNIKSTLFTNENNYINGGSKFKVIGIFDDESKFWIHDEILLDRLNHFDNIIFPVNFDTKLDFNNQKYIPTLYLLNLKSTQNDYNKFKIDLQNKYDNKLKLLDTSLKEGFKKKLNDKLIELIFIGSFTMTLLILSLFGFISMIQTNIISRKKEIGLHFALGASSNNIIKFVVSEIILLSSVSILLCYAVTFKYSDDIAIKYEICLNEQTFLISTIIILIYIFIAIICAVLKLLEQKPIDLLRN